MGYGKPLVWRRVQRRVRFSKFYRFRNFAISLEYFTHLK